MTAAAPAAPRRLLTSSRPWRSVAYLLTGWIVALAWLCATAVLLAVPALGAVLLLGGIPLGAVERWRLRLVDPAGAPNPHQPVSGRRLWTWLSTRLREPVTWRELGYATLFGFVLAWVDALVGLLVLSVGYVIAYPLLVAALPDYQPDALFGLIPADLPWSLAATPAGILILPVVAYLVSAYASGRAALTRFVLTDRADPQLRELADSRDRVFRSLDAQRRRIERDLHDGAQQRLTGLVMTLGVARGQLADTDAARSTVEQAYQQARRALAELRDLVHGIHPQVLTTRGLAPALADLAERCPIPVDISIDLPHRPPEPVEVAAWFVVSEALANVAEHSRATTARVRCHHRPGTLTLEVADDGVGGADPAASTGLLGLRDRVSVLHGRLDLHSPAGGPTVLRVELPCDW